MLVPEPPALEQLEHITPSVYEASMTCLAKAGWYAFGARSVLPEHPAGILGTSFHAVVAAAHRGELVVASASDRTPARQLFDDAVRALYDKSHPLVKLKYPTSGRLPYYNLHRERAALLATRIAASLRAASTPVTASPNPWLFLGPNRPQPRRYSNSDS